jgi:hypothetical protein
MMGRHDLMFALVEWEDLIGMRLSGSNSWFGGRGHRSWIDRRRLVGRILSW